VKLKTLEVQTHDSHVVETFSPALTDRIVSLKPTPVMISEPERAAYRTRAGTCCENWYSGEDNKRHDSFHKPAYFKTPKARTYQAFNNRSDRI
jgi:hypothetical protein